MDHCDGSFHLTTCGELFQAETGLRGTSSRQPKRNNEPQEDPDQTQYDVHESECCHTKDHSRTWAQPVSEHQVSGAKLAKSFRCRLR